MQRSKRDRVPTLVLVVMSVVAIGLVAATITSVVGVEGDGRTVRFDPSPGATNDSGGSADGNVTGGEGDQVEAGGDSIDLQICVEVLQTTPAIALIVGAVAVALYGFYRRFNVATSLLVGTGLVPIVWVSYFFTTNCATGTQGGGGGSMFSGSSVMSNEGGLNSISVPPSVAAGLFGVVIVGSVVALVRLTGEDETFEPIEDEPDEPEEADFAAAAGRAADRIEEANVAVDNAVYEAWLEMTALLDIESPDTTAPRDFADLAVDAGLERDDVAELAELFNEVRYGGKDPDTREERALEILRHVEETYQSSGGETR